MKQPLISIIVPVYNAGLYLAECLESIRNQSYKNIQVICVDDGSSDNSLEIAKEFQTSDTRFTCVSQKNQGESNSRNRGLFLCKGDYICFADCDDWVEPQMYGKMLTTAVDCRADITACGWYKETDCGSVAMKNLHNVDGPLICKEDFIRCVYLRDEYQAFAYMWNKMFSRKLIFGSSGKPEIMFDESFAHGGDLLFFANAMLRAEKFAFTEESFYHYRIRSDSASHKKDIELQKDRIRAYEKLIVMFTYYGADEYTVKLIKRFYVYHCSNLALLAFETNDGNCLEFAKHGIEQYISEYVETNSSHPERIARLEEILSL